MFTSLAVVFLLAEKVQQPRDSTANKHRQCSYVKQNNLETYVVI